MSGPPGTSRYSTDSVASPAGGPPSETRPAHLNQMSVIAPSNPHPPSLERHHRNLPTLNQPYALIEQGQQKRSRSPGDARYFQSDFVRDDRQRKRVYDAFQSGQPPSEMSAEYYQRGAKLPALSPSPAPGASSDKFPKPTLTPRSPMARPDSRTFLHPGQSPHQTTQKTFPPSPQNQGPAAETRFSNQSGGYFPPVSRHSLPNPSFAPPSLVHHNHSSSSTGTGKFTSGSASPTGSYSSYSQNDQTSPNPQNGPSHYKAPTMRLEHLALERSTRSLPAQSPTTPHEMAYPPGIPVSTSGGQATYQLMTVQTANGTVQVPVDVQAASRLADEKRRRNAGASARFRERRKKKEMEASQTIRKLETQVKELSEDCDFYRRERDNLVSVVMQAPGGERLFPRPASPRLRRAPSSAASTGDAAERRYDFVQEQPDSREEERDVRRRTSSFHGSTGSSTPGFRTPSTHPTGPSQYAYPLTQPPSIGSWQQIDRPEPPRDLRAPPPRNQLPPLQLPPVMQATPSTGPLNPYAGHRLDKPWPHGPPPHFPRDSR
ncbi:Regulatory protein cys-3 [Sphaceloma murrayae]|uniref:Regulatory protein cys-3 n=1 Tax=Sphaceloma murrayae TaxID=2082308 RepID=A0A2K1R3T2_9PEZI|nr:Regulatory protein cys-3 [Sphaceloma murrayae]